ncbi:MAG: mevalonate kinase, partial [Mariprofundales bacterium]|nr:mevalonate kinase [Mariprofundales bacterium]
MKRELDGTVNETVIMTTCSAPAKIYLFGEHAVVYGEPAIACAVELRTYVTVKPARTTTLSSGNVKSRVEKNPYVFEALKSFKRRVSVPEVSIRVVSDVPSGAGIGSSAALVVALLQALSIEFGADLNLSEIAAMAHGVERLVQGAASPTDTFISTMGGVALMPEGEKLPPVKCGIVIGNTGTQASAKKTAMLVSRVARLKKDYPAVVDPVITAIGKLSPLGLPLLEREDYAGVGRLMNINHGLLEALGVGTPMLSRLVYAARDAGAFGAKITGAGGGGCMVALTDKPGDVAVNIECAGGDAYIVGLAFEGVR